MVSLFRVLDEGEVISPETVLMVTQGFVSHEAVGQPYDPVKHGPVLMPFNAPLGAKTWRRGQTLWLKSGSPRLSLKETPRESVGGACVVSWFDGGKLSEAEIPAECLTEFDPGKQE